MTYQEKGAIEESIITGKGDGNGGIENKEVSEEIDEFLIDNRKQENEGQPGGHAEESNKEAKENEIRIQITNKASVREVILSK